MPGSLTDAGEILALDFINGRAPTDPVGPLQVSLTTTAPTDSAAGTEVTGGSYSRKNVTIGAATGTSPAIASNTNLLEFTLMPAIGGGGVIGWGIWNAAGTVRLWHGTFDTAKTTNAGDTYEIPIGDLDLTMD